MCSSDLFDFHMLPVQIERERNVISPKPFFFGLVQLLKIWRQGSKLVKVALRSDQQVFVLVIDCGEVPHKVPNVGTHSEFVDFADVERDAQH